MNTVEQYRWDLFEAQMNNHENNSGKWLDGDYMNSYGQAAWIGFNIALDAVEIVLPQEEHYWPHDYCGAVEDCRDAIEKTGLGLKVK